MQREVRAIHPALEAHMPGLSTWQALPNPGVEYLDPFLLLNHHGPENFPPQNQGLPFGPHPHRGFETLTFIFDGDLVHKDSTGHVSEMGPGGVQWMTAGKGIIHSEVSSDAFKEKGGREEVLQLWMNLPRKLKDVEPDYHGYPAETLRTIDLETQVKLHLISGPYQGQQGPHQSLTGLWLAYADMQRGSMWTWEVPEGRNVFLYVVSGALTVNGHQAPMRHLVEMGTDGTLVELMSTEPGTRLILGHGAVIDEPKAAQGPFVMNYPGEIKQAWLDYQAGKFA